MLANRCSTAASMRATANSCSIICSTAPWQNRLRQHPRFDAVQRDWLRQSRSSRPPPGCIRPATGCLTSRRRQTSAIFGADVYHVEKSQLPQQRLRAGTAADGGHRQHGRALPAAFRHGLQQQGGSWSASCSPTRAALERCRFAIGIDNMLLEEVVRKYPRLMRTTQEALKPLNRSTACIFPTRRRARWPSASAPG